MDALAIYMESIKDSKPLSREEEAELARKIKGGCKASLNRLVTANLCFVVRIALKYQHQGIPVMDLIEEGNLGLMVAAKRFDETKNFKFISYAVWWIRQSILISFPLMSRAVTIPASRTPGIQKFLKLEEKSYQKRRGSPDVLEILKEAGFRNPMDMLYSVSSPLYLDQAVGNSKDDRWVDIMPDTSDFDNRHDETALNEQTSRIETMFRNLNYREIEVLKLNFGIGEDDSMNLRGISERLKISRERVRQIKDEALRKMKFASVKEELCKCNNTCVAV